MAFPAVFTSPLFAVNGSMSRKDLSIITVQFPSLCKDVHQDNCMNLVSFPLVVSLKEDRQLQTTCRNSYRFAEHHRLSIHSIYGNYRLIRTHFHR